MNAGFHFFDTIMGRVSKWACLLNARYTFPSHTYIEWRNWVEEKKEPKDGRRKIILTHTYIHAVTLFQPPRVCVHIHLDIPNRELKRSRMYFTLIQAEAKVNTSICRFGSVLYPGSICSMNTYTVEVVINSSAITRYDDGGFFSLSMLLEVIARMNNRRFISWIFFSRIDKRGECFFSKVEKLEDNKNTLPSAKLVVGVNFGDIAQGQIISLLPSAVPHTIRTVGRRADLGSVSLVSHRKWRYKSGVKQSSQGEVFSKGSNCCHYRHINIGVLVKLISPSSFLSSLEII